MAFMGSLPIGSQRVEPRSVQCRVCGAVPKEPCSFVTDAEDELGEIMRGYHLVRLTDAAPGVPAVYAKQPLADAAGIAAATEMARDSSYAEPAPRSEPFAQQGSALLGQQTFGGVRGYGHP